MTIKLKLAISNIILIVTIIGLGVTFFYGYRYVTSVASLANDFDRQSMYLQMMLRGLNEAIINEGTPSTIRTEIEGMEGFSEIHRRLLKEIDDSEIHRVLKDEIDPDWKAIKHDIRPFLEHYIDLNDDELMVEAGKLIIKTEHIIQRVQELSEKTRAIVNENSEKSAFTEVIMGVIIICILLCASMLAINLYRTIHRPIRELITIAEGFNKGDLSIMMDEKRKDEFGTLARYFNRATSKLQEATDEMNIHAQELTALNIRLESEVGVRQEAENRISHISYHDSLTDLPNRYLFHDRLNMCIANARRHQRRAAVLLLDIDDFNRVNDTLGHKAGDGMLKEIADRIQHCIRTTDTVSTEILLNAETITIARLGGDEFTVLLTELKDSQSAVKVAGRIMKTLSEPFFIDDNEVNSSTSIGISVYPSDGETADDLLKNADAAMYYAKNQGKNKFQFYEQAMNEDFRELMSLESELKRAIKKNELLLHYQPRIDLQSGSVMSMEALVRWQKPDQGLVSPGKFIPMAEDTGLIVPMGTWVLRTACMQNKKWQEMGISPLIISVNISVKQFQQEDFLDIVISALNESALAPQFLELEITENLLMQGTEHTIYMLYELRKMGVRLSMDDFGTGYSSFSYLRRFPLDVLKIDKSFIDEIPGKKDTAAIINAIIAMSHSLNLTVVAEGVEKEEQVEFLSRNGCDQIQGYYFSRPLPEDEFEQYVTSSVHLPVQPADRMQENVPQSSQG
jgi:diguanylate cyclase (GGDEF)-like protein